MSQPEQVLKQLKSSKTLREAVAKWMVQKGHAEQYRKCTGIDSKECIGVGSTETFYGKKCPACTSAYKKKMYENARKKDGK